MSPSPPRIRTFFTVTNDSNESRGPRHPCLLSRSVRRLYVDAITVDLPRVDCVRAYKARTASGRHRAVQAGITYMSTLK